MAICCRVSIIKKGRLVMQRDEKYITLKRIAEVLEENYSCPGKKFKS